MKMTFFTKSAKKHLIALALVMLGMMGLQSCKKDEAPVSQDLAYLSVVNTSPTSATYNFYLNDAKANGTSALPFEGSVAYFPVNAGDYNAKFTTASNTESVITKKISIAREQVYTLFLIDKGDKLDYLLNTDDLSKTTEKAFIRFINLSPDAGALDLAIKGGATIVGDKAYKAVSTFVEIDPKAYEFSIKDKGAADAKFSLASMDIAKGKYYTVIATGLVVPGADGRAFGGKVITNK